MTRICINRLSGPILNKDCTSEAFIDVPKHPSEYLWIFPTGCFCADDLHFEGHGCSRGGMHLPPREYKT